MISTIHIAKNVYGGDGLGRLGDGRVVFVPGAFAGESVRSEIVEEKKKFVRARLVEVVEPSADRIQPDGVILPGMTYAALDYAAEMRTKEAQLEDFLSRARIVAPPPVNLTDPANCRNYRNKVVYHFARQNGAWILGYRQEPGHEIVDVTEDPLARPEINASLPEIRRHVLALLTQGAQAVRRSVAEKGDVTIRWSARSGVQWWIGKAPSDIVLRETTCGRGFEVPADGFYQVNPVAGESLVKAVVGDYQSHATGEILDLYCGVGVFGLCCRPERLTGIESGRRAIDFARRNAESQGVKARFFAEQVGRSLKRIRIGERTTVIVDPPRGGLEPGVPEWLARSGAPYIFYVSCDPATLVRDLRVLTAKDYEIKSLKWVDMFPRTACFETLVLLRHR